MEGIMIISQRKINRQASKGMALMITLVALMTLAIIGFGLMAMVISNSRSVTAYDNSQRSYYAARAGISHTMDLIGKEIEKGNLTDFPESITGSMEDGSTYTASITAMEDIESVTKKRWRVTSEGRHEGARRILNASVEAESFAAFAYLTKNEIAWVESGGDWVEAPVYWSDGESIEGRAHTNGFFSIMGRPMFTDRVTSSNELDSYWNPDQRTYTQGGETICSPTRFYRYHTSYAADYPVNSPDGKFTFAGGAPNVIYPSDTTGLKESANIVYDQEYIEIYFFDDGTAEVWYEVPIIYPESSFEDKYNRMILSSRAVTGGEPIPPPPPKIKDDSEGPPGETIITDPPPPPTHEWKCFKINDTSKLVIYNSGWIGIGGSTIKGEVTLIAGEGVGFWEDVKYADIETDMLGVICNDWFMVWTYWYETGDLEFHGSVLALNEGLWVNDYNKGYPRGNLTIFGSVCLGYPGTSGLVNTAGTLLSGYKSNFKYDTRLKGYSPPNYPPTGNLRLMYIEDSGAIPD
jgi:hypothetical protein